MFFLLPVPLLIQSGCFHASYRVLEISSLSLICWNETARNDSESIKKQNRVFPELPNGSEDSRPCCETNCRLQFTFKSSHRPLVHEETCIDSPSALEAVLLLLSFCVVCSLTSHLQNTAVHAESDATRQKHAAAASFEGRLHSAGNDRVFPIARGGRNMKAEYLK